MKFNSGNLQYLEITFILNHNVSEKEYNKLKDRNEGTSNVTLADRKVTLGTFCYRKIERGIESEKQRKKDRNWTTKNKKKIEEL